MRWSKTVLLDIPRISSSRLLVRHRARCSTTGLKYKQDQYSRDGHPFNQDTHRESKISRSSRRSTKMIILGTAIGVAGSLALFNAETLEALSFGTKTKDEDDSDQTIGNKWKVITREEVSEHDSLDKGIWIIYKGNVYDISKFIQHHPGGSHTIMMGAGGDVEPFWQTYTVHRAPEVQKLLASYQIGVLDVEDRTPVTALNSDQLEGPYANDPKRNPLLEVLSDQPFNAETPAKYLTLSYLTPTELFFVRNHLPVPEVDIEDYRLAVCIGTDGNPDALKVIAEFTLDDIKNKFDPVTVDSVIQCSGNRRSDLKKIKEIKGLNWKTGAIGNASWTGVLLVDLLSSLGLPGSNKTVKHVQLEGLDCDMTGQSYGASISADVALDPRREVLVAYEMNGKPLSRDHGYPLRLIAPGVTGARNVKWLSKIILSDEESRSHWQRKDYKSFSPNVDMFNLDYSKSVSVQETPVQSAICEPTDNQELCLKLPDDASNGMIPVKGYAFSGGGKMIIRVDVSLDGGNTWHTATLDDVPKNDDGTQDYTKRNNTYSWTRWSIGLPIPDDVLRARSGSLELVCRAFDSAYNSQPERAETIWNVRGVMNNSWHRVRFNLRLV